MHCEQAPEWYWCSLGPTLVNHWLKGPEGGIGVGLLTGSSVSHGGAF